LQTLLNNVHIIQVRPSPTNPYFVKLQARSRTCRLPWH